MVPDSLCLWLIRKMRSRFAFAEYISTVVASEIMHNCANNKVVEVHQYRLLGAYMHLRKFAEPFRWCLRSAHWNQVHRFGETTRKMRTEQPRAEQCACALKFSSASFPSILFALLHFSPHFGWSHIIVKLKLCIMTLLYRFRYFALFVSHRTSLSLTYALSLHFSRWAFLCHNLSMIFRCCCSRPLRRHLS